MTPHESAHPRTETVTFPDWLIGRADPCPVYFIDTAPRDLSEPGVQAMVNDALFETLCQVHDSEISGQALIKVHVGEPRCATRLQPDYITSSTRFLEYRGAGSAAAGDTTVAYTGPRGHRQNPPGNAAVYAGLAHRHGWHPDGPAGIPFVVLDRPSTAVPGLYEFDSPGSVVQLDGIQRYRDVHPAGGFTAADFLLNHAHLTLHGLAGLAGCVKSIAMGCATLQGKLRMHQSLLPDFDGERCTRCGLCCRNCPESALTLDPDGDSPPRAQVGVCIGCGECVSICPQQAVSLSGRDIDDWTRGEETMPVRMADYCLGLMQGRWDATVHVLHLYTVTALCDCVDQKQTPMVGDLGFLVGRNPFAIDLAAGRLLSEAVRRAGTDVAPEKIDTARRCAEYLQATYGIVSDVPIEPVQLG